MTEARHDDRSLMVVLGDVDAAGVLYFASVFGWHERVFTEWLTRVEWPLAGLLEAGRGLPIRRSWADYPSSARLGDYLEMAQSVFEVEETQFVFQTEWSAAAGNVVAVVRTLHVACERDPETGYFVRVPIWAQLSEHLA